MALSSSQCHQFSNSVPNFVKSVFLQFAYFQTGFSPGSKMATYISQNHHFLLWANMGSEFIPEPINVSVKMRRVG